MAKGVYYPTLSTALQAPYRVTRERWVLMLLKAPEKPWSMPAPYPGQRSQPQPEPGSPDLTPIKIGVWSHPEVGVQTCSYQPGQCSIFDITTGEGLQELTYPSIRKRVLRSDHILFDIIALRIGTSPKRRLSQCSWQWSRVGSWRLRLQTWQRNNLSSWSSCQQRGSSSSVDKLCGVGDVRNPGEQTQIECSRKSRPEDVAE